MEEMSQTLSRIIRLGELYDHHQVRNSKGNFILLTAIMANETQSTMKKYFKGIYYDLRYLYLKTTGQWPWV